MDVKVEISNLIFDHLKDKDAIATKILFREEEQISMDFRDSEARKKGENMGVFLVKTKKRDSSR